MSFCLRFLLASGLFNAALFGLQFFEFRGNVEDLSEDFGFVGGYDILFGVFDLELDVEIAMGHGVLVIGHASPLDCLPLFVCDDLSWGSRNSNFLPIRFSNLEIEPSKSLQKRDFFRHPQIRTLSFKNFMLLDVDSHEDIPCHNSRLN